jgi:hypothetical protein
MVPFFRFQIIFLLLILLSGFSACSLKAVPQPQEDFLQEINRLEKLAEEQKDPSELGKLHLRLARLYLNHKNPNVDYRKALYELETCLSLLSDQAANDELKNWIFALREMERIETANKQLRGQIETLAKNQADDQEALWQEKKKNVEIQEGFGKLRDRNANLQDMIERLKKLDLEMERKRKSIK